jgi:hypothetical protein
MGNGALANRPQVTAPILDCLLAQSVNELLRTDIELDQSGHEGGLGAIKRQTSQPRCALDEDQSAPDWWLYWNPKPHGEGQRLANLRKEHSK